MARLSLLAAVRGGPAPDVAERLLASVGAHDPAALGAERVDGHVTIGGGAIAMAGDFDRGTAADRLRDRGVEATRDDGPSRCSSYGRVPASPSPSSRRSPRRRTGRRRPADDIPVPVRAPGSDRSQHGTGTRSPNDNRTIGELVDRLRDVDAATGRVVPEFPSPDPTDVDFEALVGVGRGVDLDGSITSGKYVFVFGSVPDPEIESVRAWAGDGAPDDRE